MQYPGIVEKVIQNIRSIPNQDAYFYKKDKTWVPVSWKDFGDDIFKTGMALANLKVDVHENIGIYSQNMPEWTIVDIAIGGMRCVSVPIYATNSTNEVEYVINDAEISILFVGDQDQYDKAIKLMGENAFLKKIIVFKTSVKIDESKNTVYFKDFISEDFSEDLRNQFIARYESIKGDDLATLIYTSGTTGEPKGVMLDHANIAASIEAHVQDLGIGKGDVSLNFLPLSHIFERSWMFLCLFSQVPVYFNENPKLIAEVLKEVKPTLLCSVPRLFEKIYSTIQEKKSEASPIKRKLMDWALGVGNQYFNEHQNKNKAVPAGLNFKFKIADKLVLSKIRAGLGGNINFMPCGGAALSGDIVRFFHSLRINVKCGYGLTESTATATLFGNGSYNYGSAGKPLYGTEIKIGDNNEVLIKGPGIMRGYYKKPEATAKVFKDGWFCSGDAGRLDENGNLIITDRIKDLMKTSGGKYVAPQKLETILINDVFIEQIAIIGDHRKFVSALIVPSKSMLKSYCEHKGYEFTTMEEVIKKPEIIEKFKRNLVKFQAECSPHEKIKKFTLLAKEFTMESGELTPTLKIKRKVVAEKYKLLIDKMYE